ncbi:MAG: ATP-binding cassette domain-containing protein [Atopobiaceae bacterium]|jgi:energy-coupling factor transporter ATP-binding protein EcfA2/energy-coupling factor transporter transmembrane protein EcfT|nr:ATP-binding cassette domain-containing protein [Atopobiaceae bacterium]
MLSVSHVSFAYEQGVSVLTDVCLSLKPGQRVALVGSNGSGKSTLARIACGDLRPCSGSVIIDGYDIAEASHADIACLVGFVSQDPLSLFVSSNVADEVTFGPRCLGLPPREIERRVKLALKDCGLGGFEERNIYELSGGEQQRLALASVLAMDCRYLVLDEVTSQLDAESRKGLRSVIQTLLARGVGVLEITHRSSDLDGADKVVRLDAPFDAQENDPSVEPHASRLVAPGRQKIGAVKAQARTQGLRLEHVTAGYASCIVFDNRSFFFPFGQLTLVVGPSGAGKSTLARIAAGVQVASKGEVTLNGKAVRPGDVGLSFQRPEDQLFCNTVGEEIAFGPRNEGLGDEEVSSRVHKALEVVGLSEGMLERSPFELSGGQKRRIALASVISLEPSAYIFDEPTVGLDATGCAFVRQVACELATSGAAVVVITHDVEEWSSVADEVMELGPVGKETTACHSPQAPLFGSYVSRSGWLHQRDPLAKIISLAVLTIATFVVRDIGGIAFLLFILMLASKQAHIGWRSIISFLRPASVILIFSLLANALVVDGSYDLRFFGTVGLTFGGVARGTFAVARISLVVGYVAVVCVTTHPPDLAHAAARALGPLAHIGVPVTDISMMLSLVLRFIPENVDAFKRIHAAQQARGVCFNEGSIMERLSHWKAVLIPLFVELFSRADDVAHSMQVRGYTGTLMTDMGFNSGWRDHLLVAASVASCIVCAVL